MKAVVANAYGPPERYVVADVPAPQPGPGQIQVRITAASINPADVRVPSGDFEGLELEFPHVPGNDFAGTVNKVGAGVTRFQEGDEIFGEAVPRALRSFVGGEHPSLSTGSLAEYAVVEAGTPLVAHRPAGLDVEAAAALATVGQTSLALMASAGVEPGQTVLVVGATGGVGTAVVQLLAAAGARIVATATAEDADLLRRLGVDEVIGYAEEAYPAGVDVALNLTLLGDRAAAVARAVRPGGRMLTITLPLPAAEAVGRSDLEMRFVMDVDGTLGDMRDVGRLAVGGRLHAVISRRYRLDDGVQACVDFLRRHTTGKLVVAV